MPGICLPPHFLNDDRVRMLSNHEKIGFLTFSLLAARNRREPGVIPAMPPEMRAKKLGMPLKTYEKRLERLTAPGIELIAVRADGALVMTDLWDEDEEWDGDRGPVARSAGAERVARFRENRRGDGGQGNGGQRSNGNGSNGHGNAEALQNGHQALQNGHQALQNGSGSVTTSVTPGGQNGAGSVTNGALHPRGRVGDVSNVSGISNNSLESRDVLNVADDRPVTPAVTPPAPQPPTDPRPAQGISSRPVPRPALRVLAPHEVPAAKRNDVRDVMQLVGDTPNWKGLWFGLWKHCQEHDLLHCWDQGAAFLVERLRTSPPTGRGSVGNKGKWLRTVIMVLTANAGHTYRPDLKTSAGSGDPEGGEPQEPVDEAEAAEVRRQIEEIRARWQAEEQGTQAEEQGTERGEE